MSKNKYLRASAIVVAIIFLLFYVVQEMGIKDTTYDVEITCGEDVTTMYNCKVSFTDTDTVCVDNKEYRNASYIINGRVVKIDIPEE